jgi:hypothetical protein
MIRNIDTDQDGRVDEDEFKDFYNVAMKQVEQDKERASESVLSWVQESGSEREAMSNEMMFRRASPPPPGGAQPRTKPQTPSPSTRASPKLMQQRVLTVV